MIFFYSSDSFARYTSFKITGKISAVDIDDIVNKSEEDYSEADIKRICAEITDRYHRKGYTAFYISKAELNKNGVVELFFNESAVEEISVTGADARSEEIASAVYKKGDIFNEFTLRENVSTVKNKYNLKRINVSIRRTGNDQILLRIRVLAWTGELNFGVTTSPVYGILPSAGYTYNCNTLYAGLALSSSFAQKDTSFTGGTLFLKKEINSDTLYFTFLTDYNRTDDPYNSTADSIYRHSSLTPGIGISIIYGELVLDVLMANSYDSLDNYPGTDGGFSFCGIRAAIIYDNSKLKIDFSDLTLGRINFFSGWNFINETPVCRVTGEYTINIPVSSVFFISLSGHIFYTTDTERFLQDYVFDRYLPCRDNNYSVSKWNNTTGLGLDFEALKRTLFIGPCFKWGLYNSDDTVYNVYAPGIRGLFISEKMNLELSYLFDMHYGPYGGYLFVAATAYL